MIKAWSSLVGCICSVLAVLQLLAVSPIALAISLMASNGHTDLSQEMCILGFAGANQQPPVTKAWGSLMSYQVPQPAELLQACKLPMLQLPGTPYLIKSLAKDTLCQVSSLTPCCDDANDCMLSDNTLGSCVNVRTTLDGLRSCASLPQTRSPTRGTLWQGSTPSCILAMCELCTCLYTFPCLTIFNL